jgi:hypothetical protein
MEALTVSLDSAVVIETHENSGVEWGLSFDGNNPSADMYFKMADKQTAFRLKDFLAEHAPVSGDNPVGRPGYKF